MSNPICSLNGYVWTATVTLSAGSEEHAVRRLREIVLAGMDPEDETVAEDGEQLYEVTITSRKVQP